ncbi:hypothetical protein [Amorphus orientalis]|uniref:Uncharacterized protein n=1 Tax=Amorphus orientalis TaxID=649198 RepID=A0AAE3VMS6_9HYPH|nr:hypothetical protein [Amorphus orientalis]MDQ0314827.1 hypothetical protein [Amorphus orientalis]
MSALDDIAAERLRQIEAEGWSTEHDDGHAGGQLAAAAAAYAWFATLPDALRTHFESAAMCERDRPIVLKRCWPWAWQWWKPRSRRRDLVRAGALIVAEIERLDRLESREAA